MALISALAGALAAIGIGGATITSGALAGTVVATTLSYVVATAIVGSVLFGGVALSVSLSGRFNFVDSSPTYSSIKQTQTNPDLPVPLLYGTVKVAGNRIWQDDKYSNGIKRIVGFSDGEIEEFTDIRLNDVEASKLSGCKIEKFYGTSEQGLPTLLPNNVGLDDLGSLKYLAYLYVKVPRSAKVDINYNLTTVIKGRKIRVYTTPTTYTYQYSENPAWVMFDFLTSYNGRGLCLNANGTVNDTQIAKLFDLNSFIESAAYCDELITYTDKDGNTQTTPRFTFNMIFDSQTSHKTLIDEIQRSCRGGLFTKDGKLQFKIDKAEPVSKIFYESDILDGSETFQTIPNEENYEVLKIDYISPEHEWQKVQAYAELPTTRTGVPIEHTINCYSVTNFQQASRLAWYYLNSKRLCPYFGSFKTGFKAFDLEVGQVIQIPVILMGLQNYLVKVTSVVNNGTGTYTVNYRNYDARLYNDDLGCKEPTVLVTNLGDQYGYPDDVQNFNVVQNQNLYEFVWNYNESLTDTYEIRYGESWETGIILGKNITENKFTYTIQSKGLKKFWIKAFNGYNYSENATLDVIQINDIPDMNVLINLDILSLISGTHYHTKIYKNTIKVQTNNVLWHTTSDKWGEGDTYYKNLDKWGANVYQDAYYISQIYDIDESLSSYIFADMEYFSFDEQNYCSLLFSISDDNITWSDFRQLVTGNYTFRYIKFKVIFNVFNNVQLALTKLNVTIDVPDKIENMEAEVTSASDGITINYDFNIKPSIVATVQDSNAKYAVVPDNLKTTKNAKIYIYDNDGNLATGKLSLVLKGY